MDIHKAIKIIPETNSFDTTIKTCDIEKFLSRERKNNY